MPEIAGQFREILDVFAGHAELYAASMLYLTPFEKGIYIDNPFTVIIDKNLQVRIFCVITANYPFPCLNVSIMEKFVRNRNGIERGHS